MKLGNTLQDLVSGVTGIAIAHIRYLNGCEQFCLQPKSDDATKRPESLWIDVHQLEFVDKGLTTPAPGTGGPTPRGTPTLYGSHP